jgi:hypothetical protein
MISKGTSVDSKKMVESELWGPPKFRNGQGTIVLNKEMTSVCAAPYV